MKYAIRHTHRRLAPLPDGWLTINEANDHLVRLSESGEAEVVADFVSWEYATEPEDFGGRRRGFGLHTSADGRFAAVTDDYGWHGSLVDLAAGHEVFALHRDEGWEVYTVPFGVAFLPGDVLVAQTDWNRVDAFALPSGELLTEREVTSHWPAGGPCPETSISYFHGALHASPSGRWLLADGWFWHPAPAPSLIDVTAWLGGDTHVPERMPYLDTDDYMWDIPVAWLDDNTVALQRIHHEADRAVVTHLYDAPSRELVGSLTGLDGPMWAHAGKLHVSAAAGLETWDPGTGQRIGLVEGIQPTAHNPATGSFAELADGVLRTFHPASGVVSTPIAHYGA
ncbi:hypothetical protein M8C13_25415 [Crossiella sp. SN42]|uniref:hypothetical protein n=1 Tax=Crossiella sp. SN42 TaxID=2944808 RepID=UPI00207C3D9B|nr:hypothetical protein [Crossiella sp. SN42]MCO1579093.1 hypothetical protein [Crossiella sp. SN42]